MCTVILCTAELQHSQEANVQVITAVDGKFGIMIYTLHEYYLDIVLDETVSVFTWTFPH